MTNKKFNGFLNKKSILYSWTSFFSFVFILLVGTMLFLNLNFSSRLKKENMQLNDKITTQIQHSVDDAVTRINSDIDEAISDLDYSQIKENTYSLILNKVNSSSDQKAVAIYEKNSDRVFYGENYISLADFYDIFSVTQEDSKTNFIDIVKSVRQSGIYAAVSDEKNDVPDLLIFVKNIPEIKNSYIIVAQSESALFEQLYNIKDIYAGEFLISDNAGHIIFSSLSDDETQHFVKQDVPYNKNTKVSDSKGKKVILEKKKSDLGSWNYLYITPKNSYITLGNWLITVILLLIFVGLIFAFIKINHSYLKRILNYFTSNQEINPASNEFSQIETAVGKTIEERKKMSKEITNIDRVIKNAYISKFIRGFVYDSEEKISEALSSVGFEIKSNSFIVAIFNIDEYFTNISNDELPTDEIYSTEETNIICKNILEELVNHEYECLVVGVDRNPVCIINIPDNSDEENVHKILDKIMLEAQSFIEDNFHITSSIAISRIYNGIASISSAYYETTEIMNYKRSLGVKEYMHIKDFKSDKNNDIYYPLHLEQKLIICVNSGDFNNAKEIIEDIVDKNINQNKISLDSIKCLMSSLSNTLLRLVNETNNKGEEIKFEKNPVDLLRKHENIESFKTEYLKFIHQITENFNFKNLTGRHVNKAICYINENYSDVNLNVQTISNYMDLNAVYFSRIFKTEMKEGLLEYISRLRIDKAKELFLTTDLSVENISLMVGYNDCGTFRRVFKKYTDVTPSKYREIKGKKKKGNNNTEE